MTHPGDVTTQLSNRSISAKNTRFASAPEAVILFLLSKNKNVLLLGTCNVEITKEKILQNVPDSEEVSEAHLFSVKPSFKSTASLLVINNLSNIYTLLPRVNKYFKYKFVVVLPSSNVLRLERENLFSGTRNIFIECTIAHLLFAICYFVNGSTWRCNMSKIFRPFYACPSFKKIDNSQKTYEYGFDKTLWNCLHENLQKEIESRLQEKYSWLRLGDNYGFDTLRENDVVRLINNNEGLLFPHSVPDEPSVYIQRTIVSRNAISHSFFDYPTTSIWLIETNGSAELQEKAEKSIVENCSNQLGKNEITCSFLIADTSDSFNEISSRTNKSVHLLRFDNGNFYWVKTRGNIADVRLAIDLATQINLSESDFLGWIMQNHSSSDKVIVISDTPGMGKSYLVSSLGRKLQKLFPNRLVSYVPCAYLMNQVSLSGSREFSRESLASILANVLFLNDTAQHIFMNYIKYTGDDIELIIDGMDEVNSNCFSLALELLIKLRSQYPNIRMWLTTRAHYAKHLELLFGTLAYSISPLNTENQLYFLQKYWLNSAAIEKKNVQSNLLKKYSQVCLNNLEKNMSKDGSDIVGVPLQCMLIAEIFKDDALKYSFPHGISIPLALQKFNLRNVSDLFDLLVQLRLNSYFQKNVDRDIGLRDKIFDIHFYYAIMLLFPKGAEIFRGILLHSDISRQDYLSVGLMHSMNESDLPRFMHRAFAEYFVAKFSLQLLTGNSSTSSVLSFIFLTILETNKSSIYSLFQYSFTTYNFQELSICQFLNSLLANTETNDGMMNCIFGSLVELYTAPLLAKKISHACAKSNLGFLFKFLFHELAIVWNETSFFDSEFLAVVVISSDVSFLKYCLKLYGSHNQNSLESIRITMKRLSKAPEQISLLHLALSEGKFITFEYFLKNTKFRTCLTEKHKFFVDIVHKCVEHSLDDSPEKISGKQKILRYLANDDNFNWTISFKHDGIVPINCRSINSFYLEILLKTEKEDFFINSDNQTVFHDIAQTSCDDLHRLLIQTSKILNSSEMKHLLDLKDSWGQTILHILCLWGIPSSPILSFLKKLDADFNTDGPGFSPLCAAIKSGKSIEIISSLIKFGADPYYRFSDQSNLLHLAAKFGQLDATIYLLSLKSPRISLKSKDIYGRTPLCYAAIEFGNGNNIGTQRFIYHYLTMVSKSIHSKQCVANENTQLSIERGYSLYKISCLSTTEELIKVVFTLQNKVTDLENLDYPVIIFVVYGKEYLYYSHNGINEVVHHFKNMPQKRPTIYNIISILSKKLKFSLWHLHVITANPTNDISKNALLGWILEQNISDQLLFELLETICEKFPSYFLKQSNVLSLALESEKSVGVIKWILNKGVLVNTSDKNGYSPLHFAMRATRTSGYEYISLLLEAGAQPNAENLAGETPLSMSCWNRVLEDNLTFHLLVENGALCNSFVASSALYWLIFFTIPEKTFLDIARMLIEKGANIYTILDLHDSTLLDWARERQGQKRAAFLETFFRGKQSSLTTQVNELAGEEGFILNLLSIDFFSFLMGLRHTPTRKLNTLPVVHASVHTPHAYTRTLRTKPAVSDRPSNVLEYPEVKLYSVRHLKFLVENASFQTIGDIIPLIAFVVYRGLPECLEFVYEWFQKNIGGEISEHPLTLTDGSEFDLLIKAVKVLNLKCIKYLVEKMGYLRYLFTDKYKLLIRECVHIDQSGELIIYLGSLNPELICGDKEYLFAAKNLSPKAFFAIAKVVGNVDAFNFTKENIDNRTDGFSILHKVIEVVDSETFHNIVENISSKGLLRVFERHETFVSPLQHTLQFFDVQEKTINLIAKSGVEICGMVLYNAARKKKPFEMIKCFISNGVDVANTKCYLEGTILHYIVTRYINSEQNLEKLLECLLECKLLHKLKCTDKYGNTVIYEIFKRFKLNGNMLDLVLNSPHPLFVNNFRQNILHVAIDKRTPPVLLKNIISNKVRVYQQDADGKTCVHIAASSYSSEDFQQFVRILREHNFTDVFNVLDNERQTPIMSAANRYDILTILVKELLKESQINWNTCDNKQRNFFHHAVLFNNISDLEIPFKEVIYNCGFNIRGQNKTGGTIAHFVISCEKDFHQLVLYLLKYNLQDVLFVQDEHGFDAIAFALVMCALLPHTVQVLLNNNITFETQTGNLSYLHVASALPSDSLSNMKQNNIDCIKLLISNGIDPTLTSDGSTFLHYLAICNVPNHFDEIIKHLVYNNSVDVLTQVDSSGETPISYAIQSGQIFPQTIEFLACSAVNLNWQSTSGYTLLHSAVKCYDIGIIEALINSNVDCSVIDADGCTFLHKTPECILESLKRKNANVDGFKKVEEEASIIFERLTKGLLCKRKIDVFRQPDDNGALPLHKTMSYFDVTLETLKMFQEFGIELDMLDNDGMSLLAYAIRGKRSMGLIKSLIRMTNVKAHYHGNTIAHLLPQLCSAVSYHEIVRLLLDMGHNKIFFTPNDKNLSPFQLSVFGLEILPETLDLLIKEYKLQQAQSESVNKTSDIQNESILIRATLGKRSVKTLKTLIFSNIDIYTTDRKGNNFAHYVGCYYSAEDYHEIVISLIEMGHRNLLITPNDSSILPIVYAIYKLEILPETIHLIFGNPSFPATISDKASFPLVDDSTHTSPNHLHLVDINGDTVLFHFVKSKKRLSVIKCLVENGANPLVKNNHNNNLAHVASSFSGIEQLKYFVELGCNVNDLDNDGDNALQCLVFDNKADIYEMVIYLIYVGVEKYHRNNAGKSAYDYALDKKISDQKLLNLLKVE